MNKIKFIFTPIFILIVTTLWAGAHVFNFSAESNNDNIIIRWNTTQESNLDYFLVERENENGDFSVISQPIYAQGENSSYEFIDENAFKTSDLSFTYRLKIVDKDNFISHTGNIFVSHSVSSVRRTWGSIKALFR